MLVATPLCQKHGVLPFPGNEIFETVLNNMNFTLYKQTFMNFYIAQARIYKINNFLLKSFLQHSGIYMTICWTPQPCLLFPASFKGFLHQGQHATTLNHCK